ncbi:hypothetical protein [Anaerosporobacter faecicola]|uniref:hypothetical protein n=1 Tax=Anaerosporobacter faecicola TaxID=2718714 RepID=UPI001439CED6|nr:hypothetical protein [Anaerosporobacter faecicola]
MELKSISREEYDKLIDSNYYVYNASWFHEINKEKVDYLEYLIFKSKKNKLGIIAGVKDNCLKMPYSAPFSMLEKMDTNVKIEDIEESIDLLENYCIEKEINQIYFRTPPSFYDETFISKVQNCLLRKNYKIFTCDLNYQFYLRNVTILETNMQRNAKKNLKIANKFNFKLIYCDAITKKKEAYEIIATNRKNRGFPLRMTWEQVEETIRYMIHDFFILQLDGQSIASAIIFKITKDIYQVIYWGDIAGYTEYKPMNYLAYNLYKYYLQKGIKVLDIGPSTEDGEPNYGLCSFKESIGCEVSSKFSYWKGLN